MVDHNTYLICKSKATLLVVPPYCAPLSRAWSCFFVTRVGPDAQLLGLTITAYNR
jgi:hypothetical protein